MQKKDGHFIQGDLAEAHAKSDSHTYTHTPLRVKPLFSTISIEKIKFAFYFALFIVQFEQLPFCMYDRTQQNGKANKKRKLLAEELMNELKTMTL